METRANYVLIGLFTIAVIVAGFGFVYWFHRAGGVGERVTYRVVFDGPVSGLRIGAAVLFNGIRVGDVVDLTLNSSNPREVVATIGVIKSAPVRADTEVGVEYQGLTGIAALGLRGGSPTAAPLVSTDGRPPLLQAERGTTQDLMQSGRDVLRRIDAVLGENQEALRNTIKNLETFTTVIARNSERFDRMVDSASRVLTGAEALISGRDGKSGEIQEAVQSFKSLADNLDRRADDTLASVKQLAGNLDKRTADTLASVKQLADNLDKRTADIAVGVQRFTGSGLREWERLAVDARRAANEFERAVRNFQRNPSRVIWGGSLSDGSSTSSGDAAQPQRRRRR